MKLIIQIPCYNEAETLEIALNDLPKHIDGIDEIEYLIINDGSKDDTVKVAKAWGVNYVVNFNRTKDWPKALWRVWTPVCATEPTLSSIPTRTISTWRGHRQAGASHPGRKGGYGHRGASH